MIVGDFNLLSAPSDKNNSNFNAALASSFNDAIRTLALFELPLLDRRYTWTNKRDTPVLARLDRALFNHAWNLRLPQSALSSLPRPTSDHFPLLVTATTDIPRSQCFRFENAWLLDPLFLPTTLPLWFRPAMVADAAIDINARLKSFRFAAKVWKRKHHYTPLLENDYSFVLDLLDFYEELRPLSQGELSLRDECRDRLCALILARAAYWKQRGKFRAVAEGNENTRFFHARASQRLRRNHIRALDLGGALVVSHDAKAAVLHSFYTALLGRSTEPIWDFDVDSLYADAPRADCGPLVASFGDAEIRAAVDGMDRGSAPGPDGFGPSFFRAAWADVAPHVRRLFDQFHVGWADIGSINRAHVVLLPKKDDIIAPSSYRPVSLQNCSLKMICKALTSRL
jgi:hypothetical protein